VGLNEKRSRSIMIAELLQQCKRDGDGADAIVDDLV